MATTVRIDDETRGWLERLRSQLSLATGKRVTLEETLHLLTQRAVHRPEAFLPEVVADAPPDLSDEAWQRILRLPRRYRAVVEPENIDAIAAEDAG